MNISKFCAWQCSDNLDMCDLDKMRTGIKHCRSDCEYYPKAEGRQLLLFPDQKSKKIRCKDCQFCNPVSGYGSICAEKPTSDKRYKLGYIKVYPTKYHYCNLFKASK